MLAKLKIESQISKRYDVNHPVRQLSERLSRKSEAILEKIGELQKAAHVSA